MEYSGPIVTKVYPFLGYNNVCRTFGWDLTCAPSKDHWLAKVTETSIANTKRGRIFFVLSLLKFHEMHLIQ